MGRVYPRLHVNLHNNFFSSFGALPVICDFLPTVPRIDMIFILSDGLTRLLLLWEKSVPLLFCFWISWAEPRAGCWAGIEPGATLQQPGELTTYPRHTLET